MKVEVNSSDSKNGESPYPHLMISNDRYIGMIVYFWDYEEGIVLYSKYDKYPEGYESINWNMDTFKKFNGTITLSND